MIVEWDPAKAATNRRKHGVDFHEAVTTLEDPLSTTCPDPEHSVDERRFLTLGMSAKGRLGRGPCGPTRSGPHHQREASYPARGQVL